MNKYVVSAALASAVILPAAALAERLPLRGSDLAGDERYSTSDHGASVQTEGKDIGAARWTGDGNWAGLKSGTTDAKTLSNWIIYGKPFYAMAGGKVVGCWRNAPDNIPGSLHPDYKPNLKFAGGGNHLWILQDDGVYALYAHAKPGSIPSSLCPHNAKLFAGNSGKGKSPDIEPEVMVTNGARVEAGDKLGEIGNSGASSGGPHLHVHLEKSGSPVPMKFERGLTTPFTAAASLNGPWSPVAGKTLPNAPILFWPPRPAGNLTFNGIKSADYQRLVEHLKDSGMLPNLITCTSNGASYNSTWIPAKGQWASFHAMSPSEAASKHTYYTQQGYKRTSVYTCGTATVAVWRK